MCVLEGLEELCDGLRSQKAGVKVLLLRNNHITVKGMEHLAKTLVRNLLVFCFGTNHIMP